MAARKDQYIFGKKTKKEEAVRQQGYDQSAPEFGQ
jgi:hypothetical protein